MAELAALRKPPTLRRMPSPAPSPPHAAAGCGVPAAPPLLSRLALFEDGAHSAAWNMAMDEALLELAQEPVLRTYGWQLPALSFGCFVPLQEVKAMASARELVRRCTGGGIVVHGTDWTYSLVVPHGEWLAQAPAGASYFHIHQALARALEAGGVAVGLLADGQGRNGPCFAEPVRHDLVLHGRKVAGAAQRRSRRGLLHQGSLQGLQAPGGLPGLLARRLSSEAHPFSPTAQVRELAARLALEKYGSRAWLERR